jgi:PAS domain S-box-containing protein
MMSLQKKDKSTLPVSKKRKNQGKVPEATQKEMSGFVQELKQAEACYRHIIDNIGVGVAMIDPAMRILTLNRKMREWFPDANPDRKPLCYESFNNPPKRETCSYCPTIRTLRDGQVHEAVTNTPLGERVRNYRIIATPVRDLRGHVVAAIEMVEDITELLKMKAEREESEIRHRTIFENTGTAIAVIEEDMTIGLINNEFEKQSGFTRSEVESRMKWPEFVADRETVEMMRGYHRMRRISSQSTPKSYEFRFTDKQGHIRDVLINVDMIPGTQRSVASLIDITERKKAESSLEAKAKELEELNIALNVLLKRREVDKATLEKRITTNIQELVLPLVEDLKTRQLSPRDSACVGMLEVHLKKIASPFSDKLSSMGDRLTPRELQVAGLIRMGKSTKEIGDLLNVSKSAIDLHRHNIRKKLGLKDKRQINPRSYLLSIGNT